MVEGRDVKHFEIVWHDRHPTPRDVALAIEDAFHAEDARRRAAGEPPINVSAWLLIREGLARANREHAERTGK